MISSIRVMEGETRRKSPIIFCEVSKFDTWLKPPDIRSLSASKSGAKGTVKNIRFLGIE